MKSFTPFVWDAVQCRQEIEDLRVLLATNSILTERKQVLPLFRKNLHLAAFVGSYHPDIRLYDRIAFEYDLFGDFSCDLAVGDSVKRAYNFVEFEQADAQSLFRRQGRKSTREWSPRFDHGYSQIIDWFGKLRDTEKSDVFEARFGARSIDFMGTLVIGRDQFLEPGERQRLDYRRQHVVVDSRKIQCVTYDGLLADLTFRLEQFDLAGPAAKNRRKWVTPGGRKARGAPRLCNPNAICNSLQSAEIQSPRNATQVLPSRASTTKQPGACGPGPRQWERIVGSVHPASSRASAKIGRRSKARSS
jgi:hypothetical protein